uniref:Uncharacterized protein n=1 Tax=Oryza sativa subsp. japonica TaxID=39947 RepID=Q7XIF8_ORYSJ|nr:hypothetical protein [Oryza sativa Japonica Group]BAD30448.1 hypothetical protein [Oryza sativa Japonica Group]
MQRLAFSVQIELLGNKWIASFRQIITVEEIHELVRLGSLIQDVNLSTIPDDISWKWNESGIYTRGNAQPPVGTSNWWTEIDRQGSEEQKLKTRGALLKTWWNIWLERNNRIFNSSVRSERDVAYIVKQEIDLRRSAFRPP